MVEFEIIERVGISNISYSDAVKNAINEIKGNRNIHFFTITEQRGKVNENNDIEFQVILKIGIF